MNDKKLMAEMKFVEVLPDATVHFQGVPEMHGKRATWGENEGNRPVTDSHLVFDEKYWNLIGSPRSIVVAFCAPERERAEYETRSAIREALVDLDKLRKDDLIALLERAGEFL